MMHRKIEIVSGERKTREEVYPGKREDEGRRLSLLSLVVPCSSCWLLQRIESIPKFDGGT